MAPLFPAVNQGSAGNPVHPAYIRTAVREHALRAGIQRRVSPESLRKTYEALVDRTFDRRIHDFIDEDAFRIGHPDAYDKWRDALDFLVNPERHATRIGHDCREASIKFTNDIVRTSGIEVTARPGDTVKKLKAVLAAKGGLSETTRDHLVAYFGMTSDLAQREEHGAAKEGKPLTSEDARRLVYHSLLAMYEIDQVLR